MSAKIERRKMAACWRINADRNTAPPNKVTITVAGAAPRGNAAEFIFDMSFGQWACVVREFSREWKAERESRLAEIARIDAAIPKEQS
jgi:hypothetical protein